MIVTQALGAKYNLPTPNPERYGYTFTGWFTQSGAQITSETIVEDLYLTSLYAHWQAKTFDLTFDAAGGAFDDGTASKTLKQTFGASYNLPSNPVYTGASFEAWYSQITNGNKIGATVDTLENTTVYAHYLGQQVQVTYDPNNGTTDYQYSYEHFLSPMEMKDVHDPERPGWTFDGWYSPDNYKITVGHMCYGYTDFTLTAHWKPDTFKILFDANGGKFSGSTYIERDQTVGEKFSFPPDPERTGYVVEK